MEIQAEGNIPPVVTLLEWSTSLVLLGQVKETFTICFSLHQVEAELETAPSL